MIQNDGMALLSDWWLKGESFIGPKLDETKMSHKYHQLVQKSTSKLSVAVPSYMDASPFPALPARGPIVPQLTHDSVGPASYHRSSAISLVQSSKATGHLEDDSGGQKIYQKMAKMEQLEKSTIFFNRQIM